MDTEPPVHRPALPTRQNATYEFIRAFISKNQIPPTLREIGNALGISGPNGVICHLKMLEKKGYITRRPKMSRGIFLTGKPRLCPHCGEPIECPS